MALKKSKKPTDITNDGTEKKEDTKEWTTVEQREYLLSRLPEYVELMAIKSTTARSKYSSNAEITKFFRGLTNDWFKRWGEREAMIEEGKLPPEASESNELAFEWSDEQKETYRLALVHRVDRIKRWMRNHAKKVAGGKPIQGGTGGILSAFIKRKKQQRARRDIELYQSEFRDKINELEAAELARVSGAVVRGGSTVGTDDDSESDDESGTEGAGNGNQVGDGVPDRDSAAYKSYRMKVRRRVIKAAWEDEEEAVRERFIEEAKKEKDELAMLAAAPDAKEPSGTQRQFVIEMLTTLLHATCEEIHRLAGWSTLVMTGGPNPAAGGKISIQTVAYGKTPAGIDFPSAYPAFDDTVSGPFIEWLKRVYPKDKRRELAADELILLKEPDTLENGIKERRSSEPFENPSSPSTEFNNDIFSGLHTMDLATDPDIRDTPVINPTVESPLPPIDPRLLNEPVTAAPSAPVHAPDLRDPHPPNPMLTECGGFFFPAHTLVPPHEPCEPPIGQGEMTETTPLAPERPRTPLTSDMDADPLPKPAPAVTPTTPRTPHTHETAPHTSTIPTTPPTPPFPTTHVAPSASAPITATSALSLPATRPAIKATATAVRSVRKPQRKANAKRHTKSARSKKRVSVIDTTDVSPGLNNDAGDPDIDDAPDASSTKDAEETPQNPAPDIQGGLPAAHKPVEGDEVPVTVASGRTKRVVVTRRNADGTEVERPVKAARPAGNHKRRASSTGTGTATKRQRQK